MVSCQVSKDKIKTKTAPVSNLKMLSHIQLGSNIPTTKTLNFTGISYSINSTPKSG